MRRLFTKYLAFTCAGILFTCTTGYAQKELWGTVKTATNSNDGYLYRSDQQGNDLEIVHQFQSITNGRLPTGIIQATNGKLYGLTSQGGLNNNGTLYEYDLRTDSLQTLVCFDTLPYKRPDGQSPIQLIEGKLGMLYGQTYAPNQLFVYDITNRNLTFLGGIPNPKGPNEIRYRMHQSSNGFLYAATHDHSLCATSAPRYNSIIRIDPATATLTTLYQNPCSATEGLWYATPFIEQNSEEWYGIAEDGGLSSEGVIFSFKPTNNTYTKKYDFAGGSQGGKPFPTLIMAANGKIYGTALRGAPDLPNFSGGSGIIFEYDPTTDLYQKKYDFRYDNGSNLVVGREGVLKLKANNNNLYGASRWGIFEYNTETNTTRAAGRFGAGMAADNSANVSLIEICRPPAYKYYAQTTYALCEGEAFNFDLQCSNATSIVWKHNGTIDPIHTTPVLSFDNITPADTGSWVCELTNECGSTTPATIKLSLSREKPTVLQDNNILEAPNADAYQWINCQNNLPIDGASYQTFVAANDGAYAVILTRGACKDTSDCYTVNTTSIQQVMTAQGIKLYPNPVADKLEIQLQENTKIIAIDITTTTGKPIGGREGNHSSIEVSSLPPGLYFISVHTDKGFWNGKFVKK